MNERGHASLIRILKPIWIRFVKDVCDVGCVHSSGPQFFDELGATQGSWILPFLLNMGRCGVGQVPVPHFFDFDHAVMVPFIRILYLVTLFGVS